jgi:hypothetical protein
MASLRDLRQRKQGRVLSSSRTIFVREDDYEQAVVPQNARALLSHFDERSRHYEVKVNMGG